MISINICPCGQHGHFSLTVRRCREFCSQFAASNELAELYKAGIIDTDDLKAGSEQLDKTTSLPVMVDRIIKCEHFEGARDYSLFLYPDSNSDLDEEDEEKEEPPRFKSH